MSGIGGLVDLTGGPVAPPPLEAMAAALAARGPDGGGTWLGASAGLVYRALHATSDARDEAQPWVDAAGRVIVLDGRIDDRDALARGLGMPAAAGDAALLLAAFGAWDVGCVDRVSGDFAFAIWEPGRRRLVLGRDVFGARPLRWVAHAGRVAFASDTHALRASGVRLGAIDEVRVVDYLVGGVLEGADVTSTFDADVRRLAPGHVLIAEGERVTTVRAARLDGARGPHVTSIDEGVEAFRALFERAVASRLRGAGPVASMLSGGLDSSSIVAVARDLLRRAGAPPLATFSVLTADEATCPEAPHVRAILAQGELAPTLLSTDGLAGHAAAVRRQAERTDDPFDVNVFCVPLLTAHAAGRAGHRVLLDGVDGDLATSHQGQTPRYALADGDPRQAWREAAGNAAFHDDGETVAGVFVRQGLLPWLVDRARPHASDALLRGQRWLSRRRVVRALVGPSAVHPDLLARVSVDARVAALQPPFATTRRPRTPAEDHLAHLEWGVLPAALERYDRVAAGQGVEVRHPLLDRALVELCLALPWRHKVHDGQPKALLRRAMAGVLPASVLARRADWNVSWRVRLGLLDHLAAWLDDTLATGPRIAGAYVRADAFARARAAVHTRDEAHLDEAWQLAFFVTWLAGRAIS